MLKRGEQIHIERADGFSTFGTFIEWNDENVMVMGTVGDLIGKRIIVSKKNINQIIVLESENNLKEQYDEKWRKEW